MENEIDKITEGVIPEFHDRFVRCSVDSRISEWRADVCMCNSGGHRRDPEWTTVIVGLPEYAMKAFQVRQHRISWRTSQVRVKVGEVRRAFNRANFTKNQQEW